MPLQLLDLPRELLITLPSYLHNIEDFVNAASSCRTLRDEFGRTLPNVILRLAASSAPVFFSPHPWFLVLATARQVGEWAIGNETRTADLREAFRGGIDGLFDLCVRVGGLTMEDIRRLHLARFSTINPVAKKLDQMAGKEWYSMDVDEFWYGGVSEANTVSCEEQSVYQIIVYWELFGSTLRSYLQPESNLPRFDLETRLEYIKYCIPCWTCKGGYPGFEVLPVGPYSPEALASNYPGTDQISLKHILMCGRWNRLWQLPRSEVGLDFSEDESWRQMLWHNACMSFGLESMEIIRDVKVTSECDRRFLASETVQPDPVLTPAWKERLSTIREQIQRLDATSDKPSPELIGVHFPHEVSQAPNIAEEVYVCMRALWPGVCGPRLPDDDSEDEDEDADEVPGIFS